MDRVIEAALEEVSVRDALSIDVILDSDARAREAAWQKIRKLNVEA